jgi:hypothetical protein
LAKGKKTAKQRLARLKRRKFMRDFGENLIKQTGAKPSDFKASGFIKGKLGLFGGTTNKGRKASDSGSVPSMKSPSSESNKTNPSLSTLVDQLESLVKTAKNIGVISKEQQKSLLTSIIETRKNDKETFIENNGEAAGTLQGGGISAETLAPLSTAIEELTKKLRLLNTTLDEKQEESENEGEDEDKGDNRSFASKFFDNLGFGKDYEGYKKRKNRPLSKDEQTSRRIAERNRRASRERPEDLLNYRGKPITGDALTQRLDALDRVRRQGSIFSRFKSSVGGSLRSARAGISSLRSGGVKSALKKIAGPLINQTLGRTVLKSIPIVALLGGGGFAISKLLKGDTAGAGIDPSSGLAGPLSAVPAMTAAITKDSYAGVYGIQPEQDPEAPKRIKELKTGVEGLITETIGGQVEVQPKPDLADIDNALIGDANKSGVQAESKPTPVSMPNPPAPANPNPAQSSSDGGGGTGGAGGGGSGGSGVASSGESSGFSLTPELMEGIKKTSDIERGLSAQSGAQLNQQSIDVNRMEEQSDVTVQSLSQNGPPMPSTMPTVKPGASGMGEVRSPYYEDMASLASQVYF